MKKTDFMFIMKKLSFVFPDRVVIPLKYLVLNGHYPNLREPKTFNEKLLWLNLYNHDPILNQLVDKYEVRVFVKERIGEQHLVPMIGVWNTVDEIDFDALPEQFVLKATHDSGSVVVVKNKAEMNVQEIKAKLSAALSQNYYYHSREWAYKDVKPRIIGEYMIQTENGEVPNDYKFFCFNGEPKMFFVATDRGHNTKFDFYTMECEHIPCSQHYPNSKKPFVKPAHFEEMVECAKKLSKGFPQVRVDFYEDKFGNVLLGELTFIHFSGMHDFKPDKYNELFGQYIDLSLVKANR